MITKQREDELYSNLMEETNEEWNQEWRDELTDEEQKLVDGWDDSYCSGVLKICERIFELKGDFIMGMYTELVMACELKNNVPEDVIETLKYMTGKIDYLATVPIHDLFQTSRWEWMLRSSSYYFDGITNSILKYDDISKTYRLTVRCDLKNYDNEIQEFLNWIQPYSNTYGFVGYTRYEEAENPTLIYFNDKSVEVVTVTR